MFLLNGVPISADLPFTIGSVQYPANWIRVASVQDRLDIGITEISEQTRPNDKFYIVTDNNNGTYSSVDRVVADVKVAMLSEVESSSVVILSVSDWKLIRYLEAAVVMPESSSTHRSAVRAYLTASNSSINACTTIAQLAALTFSWPVEISSEDAYIYWTTFTNAGMMGITVNSTGVATSGTLSLMGMMGGSLEGHTDMEQPDYVSGATLWDCSLGFNAAGQTFTTTRVSGPSNYHLTWGLRKYTYDINNSTYTFAQDWVFPAASNITSTSHAWTP